MIISEKQIMRLIIIAQASIHRFFEIGNIAEAERVAALIYEIALQQPEELKVIE